MNSIEQIQTSFNQFLSSQFNLGTVDPRCNLIINTDPQKQQFGDLSSSAALILAPLLQKNPREVAQTIVDNFSNAFVKRIDIAGPGFINLFLKDSAFKQVMQELFEQNESFFTLGPEQPKYNYNDEFISANPTGPLHFGHGRGGIIGDVAGNVLRFLGHTVTKEFYINDAGSQVIKLGTSLKIRCQQLLGLDVALPEDAYHGQYLVELAQECIAQHGNDVIKKSDEFFADYAKDHLLEQIKQTVTNFGISFDIWFSESELHKSSSIEKAIQRLEDNGYIYTKDGALWFKSTKLGDDKDRVLKKSSGEWTYAAADIAYLLNKVERGFNKLIMVLGHDHHSYATRLENFRKGLKLDNVSLKTILYQLVHLKKGKEMVQMSKRSGKMITLNDVINAVGKDVARFFFLHRKAEAPLEFDLELALKKTEENPVFYLLYAYVRTNSILKKAFDESQLQTIIAEDIKGISSEDHIVIKKIVALKSILETIGTTLQTHLLAYYALELADIFHRYYSHHRVIDLDNIEQSRSRILLVKVLNNTFELVLKLLGLSRPEKM